MQTNGEMTVRLVPILSLSLSLSLSTPYTVGGNCDYLQQLMFDCSFFGSLGQNDELLNLIGELPPGIAYCVIEPTRPAATATLADPGSEQWTQAQEDNWVHCGNCGSHDIELLLHNTSASTIDDTHALLCRSCGFLGPQHFVDRDSSVACCWVKRRVLILSHAPHFVLLS